MVVRLKVKGPDIYIPTLTGKEGQQRFTMRSGVLTSISIRQRGAIIGRPPISQTNGLWIRSLQLDKPTYAPASLHPATRYLVSRYELTTHELLRRPKYQSAIGYSIQARSQRRPVPPPDLFFAAHSQKNPSSLKSCGWLRGCSNIRTLLGLK